MLFHLLILSFCLNSKALSSLEQAIQNAPKFSSDNNKPKSIGEACDPNTLRPCVTQDSNLMTCFEKKCHPLATEGQKCGPKHKGAFKLFPACDVYHACENGVCKKKFTPLGRNCGFRIPPCAQGTECSTTTFKCEKPVFVGKGQPCGVSKAYCKEPFECLEQPKRNGPEKKEDGTQNLEWVCSDRKNDLASKPVQMTAEQALANAGNIDLKKRK